MDQYKHLINNVLSEGAFSDGRNGRTISTFGETMTFYMKHGFPILNLRKLNYMGAIREMYGFLNCVTNSNDFRDKCGTGIWDLNANHEPNWLANPHRKGDGDLGPVYGEQWRNWACYHSTTSDTDEIRDSLEAEGYKNFAITLNENGDREFHYRKNHDQVAECIDLIMKSPGSRRILFHGWNPAENNHVALPSCHTLYQFGVDQVRKEISMNIYLRSNDVFLGAPFNIIGAAFLLQLFGLLTGYTPYKITYTIGDAHIYESHIEAARELVKRENLPLATMSFSDKFVKRVEDFRGRDPDLLSILLNRWTPDDVIISDYVSHPEMKVKMVV